MKITNRDIEKATKRSLTQVKRWVVAFLEPDPESGQHSGKSRSYSFDEAFRVCVGGDMVTELDLTLSEARTVLDQLDSWMKKRGISFSNMKAEGRHDWKSLTLRMVKGDGGAYAEVKEILEIKESKSRSGSRKAAGSERIVTENYVIHSLSNVIPTMDTEAKRELALSRLAILFWMKLKGK